jgi:hypothetical protein
MRLKNTWILLVIAVVFLVYFFAIEQPRHHEEIEESERSTRITDLKLENVHHVTIRRDAETLAFTREGEAWRMTAPVDDKANNAAVNTLVSSAVNARIERTVQPSKLDASSHGLGMQPDATLYLQTEEKDTSLTIRLGGHNITKSHFYAQLELSNDVLLLPAGLRRYAMQPISDYRDDSLIDFVIDDVNRLRISSLNDTLVWEKNSSDRWTAIVAGDTIFGDASRIEAILRRLRGIRVRKFLSDDPADLSKFFPGEVNTLTFWTGFESTGRSVYFKDSGADTCHARVMDNNRITSIEATILRAFAHTYDDLRDYYVFHFDRSAIHKIRLETADTTATITKIGREWAFANPALGEIDQGQVIVLFQLLTKLRFSDVIQNRITASTASLFDHAVAKLTLYGPQDEITDELLSSLSGAVDSSQPATSRSSRLLGRITAEDLAELERTFRTLRSQ